VISLFEDSQGDDSSELLIRRSANVTEITFEGRVRQQVKLCLKKFSSMTGVSEATTKDTKYTKTFSSVSSISWLIILRPNSVRLGLTCRSCLRAIDNSPDRLTSSRLSVAICLRETSQRCTCQILKASGTLIDANLYPPTISEDYRQLVFSDSGYRRIIKIGSASLRPSSARNHFDIHTDEETGSESRHEKRRSH